MTAMTRIDMIPDVTADSPILAFYQSEAGRALVSSVAPGPELGTLVVARGDADEAVRIMRRGKRPAVVIYDVADSSSATRDIEMLARHGGSALPIIAIGHPIELSRYRQMLAAGAADYTEYSPEGAMLADIIGTARRRRMQANAGTSTSHSGKVIVFCGSRGGVGATSSAIATAWSLAHQNARKTTLLDLDLTQGTVAFALDIDPGHGLREGMEQPARIDAMFIERSLVRAGAGLTILSAEEDYDSAIETDPKAIVTLVDELKQNCDCVVIDLPRGATALHRAALAAADDIVLVAAPSLAGLRDAIRLANFCTSVAHTAVLKVIMGPSAGDNALPKSEFEKALGRKIELVLPFDAAVAAAAANSGQSIIEISPTCPLSRALASLPAMLGYAATTEQAPRRRSLLHWPWSGGK